MRQLPVVFAVVKKRRPRLEKLLRRTLQSHQQVQVNTTLRLQHTNTRSSHTHARTRARAHARTHAHTPFYVLQVVGTRDTDVEGNSMEEIRTKLLAAGKTLRIIQ